jgi:hypothetical protein
LLDSQRFEKRRDLWGFEQFLIVAGYRDLVDPLSGRHDKPTTRLLVRPVGDFQTRILLGAMSNLFATRLVFLGSKDIGGE